MTLFGFLLALLVVANLVWGFQTKFKGSGWIYWVNILVSLVLALGYFLDFIPLQ